MTFAKVSLLSFILFSTLIIAQPELDINPDRIEFEDLFNRFDYTYLVNKGDAVLTIDSIAYNNSIYIIDFENNLQLPFTIIPDDSIRMNVTLSGFYFVTVTDTTDNMLVFNNGIKSPEPIEIRIDFFEDEFYEIRGTVSDSLDPVDSATVYFFYDGIYLLDTARTNSNGYYVKSLPEGNYTIGVEKQGYYTVFHDSTYDPFFAELVHLDDFPRTINFYLKRIDNSNLYVSGQVIDSTDNIQINRGIIIVRTGTHVPVPKENYISVLLDTINVFAGFIKSDGTYKVYTQLPDYYYIQAYTNNFLPGYYNDEGIASVFWQSADSVLIDNAISDKNISLIRDSSYGGGSISGDITFTSVVGQNNFEGITVLARNINNGALYTYNFGKEIGEFKVTNIPYGTYELIAQKIGIKNAISEIVVIDPVNNQIVGINLNFDVTDVEDNVILPDNIILNQNYPNPFNPSTNISFYLPNSSMVKLKVINILGESIETIVYDELSAGLHIYQFNGRNLSSGVYLFVLETNNNILSRKMLLIK